MNPLQLGAVEPEAAPIAIGAWFVAMLFFWLWWSRLRFARLLRDVPSTPIQGVFVGLVETSGQVEHDDPLIATLSGTPCVQYGWSVSEQWLRRETYRDSKWKTQTRTRRGSDIVAAGGAAVDLRLRDETGAIIVRVNGAAWTAKNTFSRTVSRGDPLYHTQAPDRVVSGSVGRRTFTESAVPIGSTAWIMGNARIRPDGQALEIGSGGEEGVFMISLSGERTHSLIARALAITGLVLGTACALGGGMALAGLTRKLLPTLSEEPAVLLSIAASGALWFLLIIVMWSFIIRNGAVRVRTRWERAASLVDVELRRRADLVPNLVAVTRASAAHEASIQRAVAELRAGAASSGIFHLLIERYPTLTADASFLLLQKQLTDTESRIAQARLFEIQSRERLLERLQSFPEGLIARVMGVSRPPPALASPAPQSSSQARRSPS
jgi:hypothetical protein